MKKPDFTKMTQQELRDYFMTHRDNQDAFYAYIDRLHREEKWIEMPALKSLDDLNQYPDFVARFNGNLSTENEH